MRLVDIRTYPVKGLRGASFEAASVEPCGLAGDRRWLVVDQSGKFLTQRVHPCMALIAASTTAGGLRLEAPGQTPVEIAFPDEGVSPVEVVVWRDRVPARPASREAAAMLERAIGVPCRLVWMHDPNARAADPAYAPAGSTVSFADSFPVLLASLGSLADLNLRLASPIPIGRFRPNLVVEGASPWSEDRWRRIRIGDVLFSVARACERCIVTTIDPDSGLRPDKTEPLRTLATFRKDISGGVMFGQNLVPEKAGRVSIGDDVEILEFGPPNVELVGSGP